jgi:paraquat-inducible protein A
MWLSGCFPHRLAPTRTAARPATEETGTMGAQTVEQKPLMSSAVATSSSRADAAIPGPAPEWIECRDCGLFQTLPAPSPGHDRACRRCHRSFGPGQRAFNAALPLAVTALVLFAVAQSFPLIGIDLDGLRRATGIGSGILELLDNSLSPLAIIVLLVATVAPLLRISANAYVLTRLHRGRRPRHLAAVFRLAEQLRPWAMLDVLLLGTLVAIAKLHDLAAVEIGIGCWSLGVLILTLAALDSSLDRHAVWVALHPVPASSRRPAPSTSIGCHACDLVHATHESMPPRRCTRCRARLSRRKPDSVSRTWAFVVTGVLLYIPANAYPALTVISLGQGAPSTILGGVVALMNGEDWPLALLIFAASVAVPVLKLLGLIGLLLSVQLGRRRRLLDRTRLYRLIGFVGRWSTIDVFVTALLAALVTLGRLATVEPGPGILAFAGVVLATMLAAESFDPRLMWDAAQVGDA